MRRAATALTLLLVAAAALTALFALPEALAAPGGSPILLKSRTIAPAQPALGIAASALPTLVAPRHLLLQLDHIPDNAEKEAFRAQGIDLLSYVPENAWLARVSTPLVPAGVTYLAPLAPADKVDPRLGAASAEVLAFFFPGVPLAEREALASQWDALLEGDSLRLTANPLALAAEDAIQWVEPVPLPLIADNDGSRNLIEVDLLQQAPLALNGTNVTVAVWDGGYANHTDYVARSITGDPGEGSNDSHATHVAGTVLGDGAQSGYLFKGMAPNATLVTFEWPDIGPSEATAEANDSILNNSAVISQNSWGYDLTSSGPCSAYGDYDSFARAYDVITAGVGMRPQSVVFSAGNDRDNSNCGQSTTLFNTTPGPGNTAKNTIVVGAVDDSAAMLSFSSWGPTDDGRVKPDVVAAGSGVVSTALTSGSACVNGSIYAPCSGTSMSAPGVSGALALVYEAYKQAHSGNNPNVATAKALLLHTTVDLNNTGPDYTTGYGLVNAKKAANKAVQNQGSAGYIIQSNVSNNQNRSYNISVPAGQPFLNVTLVWNDYPGTALAAVTLVNDLDLIVLDGSGNRSYPWTLNPSTPAAQAVRIAKDDRNPVEQVRVDSPPAGNYTIVVAGTSVSQAPQNFSLILDDTEVPLWNNITANVSNGSTSSNPVHFNSSWSDNSILESIIFELNGVNTTVTANVLIANGTFTANASLAPGNHSYRWYASDTDGNWNGISFQNLTTHGLPTIALASPANASFIPRGTLLNFTIEHQNLDIVTYNNGTGNFTLASPFDINTTNWSEGNTTLQVWANTTFGNVSSAVFSFAFDTTAPNDIRLVSPTPASAANLSATSAVINATFNDTNANGCVLQWSNGTTANYTMNRTNASTCELTARATNAQASFVVYGFDAVGRTVATATQSITFDTVAPAIALVSPANASAASGNGTTVNVTINDTNLGLATCALEWWNATSPVNLTMTRFGSSCIFVGAYASNQNVTFQVYVNDSANNSNSTGNLTLLFDSIAPSGLELLSPTPADAANLSATSATINLSFNDTNAATSTCVLQWDNGTAANYTMTKLNATLCQLTAFATNRMVTYRTYAVDPAGNATATASRTITFDTTAPAISFIPSTPANATALSATSSTINVSLTDSNLNLANCVLEWDNGTAANYTMALVNASANNTCVLTAYASNRNVTYRVYANDSENNTNATSIRHLTFDTIVPNLAVLEPRNVTYGNASFPLTLYRNDTNLASMVYSLDGAANTTFSANATINTTNATHSITIWANDTAGNANTSTIVFTADGASPFISASLNTTLVSPGENVTVSATIADLNVSAAWVNLSNASWSTTQTLALLSGSSYQANLSTAALSPGTYNLTVHANDSANRTNSSFAGSFEVALTSSVNLSFVNQSGNTTNVSWVLLYNGTDTPRNQSDNTSLNTSVPSGLWDLNVTTGAQNRSFNVTFRNLNLSANISTNITLDPAVNASALALPAGVGRFVRVVATSAGANFSSVLLLLFYNGSNVTSAGRVNVFACHSWNGSDCTGSWENATANSTIDTAGNFTRITTPRLSAFAVVETQACGDGVVDPGETSGNCCEDTGCGAGLTCNTVTHACTASSTGSGSGSGGGGGGGGASNTSNASNVSAPAPAPAPTPAPSPAPTPDPHRLLLPPAPAPAPAPASAQPPPLILLGAIAAGVVALAALAFTLRSKRHPATAGWASGA